MSLAVVSPSLYYPYIHVHDEEWLKATLLTSGSVRRIAPRGFVSSDSNAIKPYCELEGPHKGPLLDVEEPHSYECYSAQADLAKRLFETEHLAIKFTRHDAVKRYGSDQNFHLHRGKAQELVEKLESRGLAWTTAETPKHQGDWVCVHPLLGEAIMTCTAIAIASAKGLNAVTTNYRTHSIVSSHEERHLLGALLANVTDPVSGKASEFARLVVRTALPLKQLSAEDIASILRGSPPLGAFLSHLSSKLTALPQISDKGELLRRMEILAPEVRDEWEAFKKGTWWTCLGEVVKAADFKVPGTALLLMTSGSIVWSCLGGALAIGAGIYTLKKSVDVFKDRAKQPLNYLSVIEDRIHTVEASRLPTPPNMRQVV